MTMHRFPLSEEPPDEDAGAGEPPPDAAQQVDPRLRHALDASAGQDVMLVTEEANAVLTAAVRELQDHPSPALGGVAPVLGAGVVAEFLKHGRPDDATRSGAEGSRIDERR